MNAKSTKNYTVSLLAAAIGLCSLQSAEAQFFYPANNGFESPDLSGGYAYGPSNNAGTPPVLPSQVWIFSGDSGIAANGSAFGVTGAGNTQQDGGTTTAGQAAFLQSYGGLGSSISQTITLDTTPATYTVSFDWEGRVYQGPNEITVSLGGDTIFDGTPGSTSAFAPEITLATGLLSGSQTLVFTGVHTSGDTTTFIDNVVVTEVVPEPSTWVLILGGFGLMAWRLRLRRS